MPPEAPSRRAVAIYIACVVASVASMILLAFLFRSRPEAPIWVNAQTNSVARGQCQLALYATIIAPGIGAGRVQRFDDRERLLVTVFVQNKGTGTLSCPGWVEGQASLKDDLGNRLPLITYPDGPINGKQLPGEVPPSDRRLDLLAFATPPHEARKLFLELSSAPVGGGPPVRFELPFHFWAPNPPRHWGR
jgi:hypothetical protein